MKLKFFKEHSAKCSTVNEHALVQQVNLDLVEVALITLIEDFNISTLLLINIYF